MLKSMQEQAVTKDKLINTPQKEVSVYRERDEVLTQLAEEIHDLPKEMNN